MMTSAPGAAVGGQGQQGMVYAVQQQPQAVMQQQQQAAAGQYIQQGAPQTYARLTPQQVRLKESQTRNLD